jgi:hypothetical protein
MTAGRRNGAPPALLSAGATALVFALLTFLFLRVVADDALERNVDGPGLYAGGSPRGAADRGGGVACAGAGSSWQRPPT